MAPQVKDPTWNHADKVNNYFFCKYCKKHIKEGGIHRLKQHLASQRGQVSPCDAPNIDAIRLELINLLEKHKEEKVRKKEMEAEIGRREHALAKTSVEGSCSDPSVHVRDPFLYMPPPSTHSQIFHLPHLLMPL